jgi:putative ABC transport system substrate-binding protein
MRLGPLTAGRVLGFLSIFGWWLACSSASSAAEESRTWQIGLIHVGLDHVPPSLDTLRQTLHDLGYGEGKNLVFDWRNQPSEEAARVTAREFVEKGVDLIVAFEDQSVRAARAATSEIPIVFLHSFDPVFAGYIESLARPGGNITGPVSNLNLIAKRLELLKEIDPEFDRVLLLLDPMDPYTPRELETARGAAAKLDLTLVEREVTVAADLERVFGALEPGEVDAMVPASPNLLTNHTELLARLASRERVPYAAHGSAWAKRGALFTYAPDFPAVGPVAAQYIDRIFRGANPADLPVEEISRIKLVINLRVANELGIEIPPSVLLRADEVLE